MADCRETKELNNSYLFMTTFSKYPANNPPIYSDDNLDLKNLPGMMNPDEGSAWSQDLQ